MTQPDFIQIPQPVLTDGNLQTSDKIVFGYIYWMTKLALMKCIASNSTLAELCGVSERNIQLSLARLEKQGYVRKIYVGEGKRNRGEIQCLVTYAKQASVERTTVRTRTKPSSHVERTTVRHSIKREEDTFNKNSTNVLETTVSYGKPEINELFDYWNEATGVGIESNVKRNRNACANLYKKYGTVKLRQLVDGVALAQSTPYAPRISDFVDLQTKLTQLLTWGKSRTQTEKRTIKV